MSSWLDAHISKDFKSIFFLVIALSEAELYPVLYTHLLIFTRKHWPARWNCYSVCTEFSGQVMLRCIYNVIINESQWSMQITLKKLYPFQWLIIALMVER